MLVQRRRPTLIQHCCKWSRPEIRTSGSRRAIAGWRVISNSMRETDLISLWPRYSPLFSVCHTGVSSCSGHVLWEFQGSATTVPCGRSSIKSAWQCQKTDLKSEPLCFVFARMHAFLMVCMYMFITSNSEEHTIHFTFHSIRFYLTITCNIFTIIYVLSRSY